MKSRCKYPALFTAIVAVFCLVCGAPAFAGLNPVTNPNANWSEATTDWFKNAAGTARDPYIIATSNDLAGLAKLCDEGNKFASKNFILVNDIDLEGKEWEPIGWFNSLAPKNNVRFSGVFDGRGHVIRGLKIGGLTDYDAALFASTANVGVIKNLSLVDARVSMYSGSAGLVAWHSGIIENCYVSGSFRGVGGGGRSYVGAVACLIDGGKIRNVIATGSVVSDGGDANYAGGIIGMNAYGKGTIENTVAACTVVSAMMNAGGIMGSNLSDGDIFNCVSVCDSVKATFTGGIVGAFAYGLNNHWLKVNSNQPSLTFGYDNGGKIAVGLVDDPANLPVVAGMPMVPAYVQADEDEEISTTLYPIGGNTDGLKFEWSSANSKIATVTQSDGPTATVTGVARGATTVSLAISNSKWAGTGKIKINCLVTVGSDGEIIIPDADPEEEIPDEEEPEEEDTEDVETPLDDEETENAEETEEPVVVGPEDDGTDQENTGPLPVKENSASRITSMARLPEDTLKLDSGGNLVFDGLAAAAIARTVWPSEAIEDVTPLPLIETNTSKVRGVAEMKFRVPGSSLLATDPRDVKVLKIRQGGRGDSFAYTDSDSGAVDKTFTIRRSGVIFTGEIQPKDQYDLVLFVRDGGDFDLDPTPGRILDPAVVVKSEAREANSDTNGETDNGRESGDGCGAGASGAIALIALALAAARPLRRK
jgi:hypothetical protein